MLIASIRCSSSQQQPPCGYSCLRYFIASWFVIVSARLLPLLLPLPRQGIGKRRMFRQSARLRFQCYLLAYRSSQVFHVGHSYQNPPFSFFVSSIRFSNSQRFVFISAMRNSLIRGAPMSHDLRLMVGKPKMLTSML